VKILPQIMNPGIKQKEIGSTNKKSNLLMWLLGHFPAARSMLEIGSGTGHFTRWFENEQDMQVYGLDKSRAMLNKAKEFGSCRLVQGDAIKLPIFIQIC